MHESSVDSLKTRDTVKNISPNIIIISLMNNAVIFTKGQFGGAIHWGAGKSLKHHDHDPFKENDIVLHDY